jgi:DNA-binding LytR/AlgR family response regulator
MAAAARPGDAAAVRAVAEGIVAADNARDLERAMAFYAEDATLWPPDSAPVTGRAAIRPRYEALFVASQPELATELDALVVDGALATAVGRVRERMQTRPARLDRVLDTLAHTAPPKKYLHWLNVSQGQNVRLITIDEVCYFQADNKYTMVMTPEQESLIRRPIKELVDELDPSVFWQIHRGTVVNVNAISGVTRDIGGHLRVRLKERKETLPVSDPYVHRFKQM